MRLSPASRHPDRTEPETWNEQAGLLAQAANALCGRSPRPAEVPAPGCRLSLPTAPDARRTPAPPAARRFTDAGAEPRPAVSVTTFSRLTRRTDCQSIQSNTSVGTTPSDIDASLIEEPSEVHQVERVRPHRRRRERPRLEMTEERVGGVDPGPRTRQPMRAVASLHRAAVPSRLHRSSPPNSDAPSSPPSRKANRDRSARSSSMS